MILRNAIPGKAELGQFGLRHRHALLGGAGIPRGRRGVVALDPGAVLVKHGDVELCREVPLLRRKFEPSRRVRQALRHALATREHSAQGELRLGIAGIGGRAVPQRSLHLGRCRAVTGGVHARQGQHGRRIPHSRGLP
jgi:hypothetical protein